MKRNRKIRLTCPSTSILLAFIAVLTLVAHHAQGQEKGNIVWKEPSVGYNSIPVLKVESVELNENQTTLMMIANGLPDSWFRIAKGSFLQSDGKRYAVVGSDSIPLGEKIVFDNSYARKFNLIFEPLPTTTKEFDFMEGDGEEDWKIFAIHDKDFHLSVTTVPADYLADYDEDDELPLCEYSEQPATIHYRALNYRKGMNTEIHVQYIDLKNPVQPKDTIIYMNDDGCADISLTIYYPQVIQSTIFNVPWSSTAITMLAPGKEVTLLVDMLHADDFINTKFVGYKGYGVKTDRELYEEMVAFYTDSVMSNSFTLPSCKDMKALKTFHKDFCKKYAEWLDKRHYSNTVQEILLRDIDYNIINLMKQKNDSLANTPEFGQYVRDMRPNLLYAPDLLYSSFYIDACKYVAQSNERGFVYDLARYTNGLRNLLRGEDVERPIIDDEHLSALYNEVAAEYISRTSAQKTGLADNLHYLELNDVEPQNILQTIIDRYRGKTVLVDLWATWCGPCHVGHRKMQKVKEELKDKDIVYIYITSSTSPFEKWKEQTADISGEHYYVTDSQMEAILHTVNSSGYPTYIIFSSSGVLSFSCIGFPGEDVIKAELQHHLSNSYN